QRHMLSSAVGHSDADPERAWHRDLGGRPPYVGGNARRPILALRKAAPVVAVRGDPNGDCYVEDAILAVVDVVGPHREGEDGEWGRLSRCWDEGDSRQQQEGADSDTKGERAGPRSH